MKHSRWPIAATSAALLIVAAAYLHDPPWVGGITSGLRDWEEHPPGTRFRWTVGRASFFVPSDAEAVTLPLRAFLPGPSGLPVTVEVSVDDRWLADVVLHDPNVWHRTTLPMRARSTHRRFRRVDLRVSRTVGPRILGVQTGEIALERWPPVRPR